MRCLLRPVLAVVLGGWICPPVACADEPSLSVDQLVRAALRAELNGDNDQRGDFLQQARSLDPNHAPARWHSGQLRLDGAWLTLDEATGRFAADARLAEYRRRRGQLVDTVDQQRQLARWCSRAQLHYEAAVHWQRVLDYQPGDAEAVRALRLRQFNGHWLTPDELAAARQLDNAQRAATRQWQPRLIEWRKQLADSDADRRADALAGIQSIRDPAAIPVMEAVLCGIRGELGQQAQAAFIVAMADIPDDLATQALLRQVLQHGSLDAARELKGRPLASYVPQLIAALPEPFEVEGFTSVAVMIDGTTFRDHEVTVRLPERDVARTFVYRDTDYYISLRGVPPQFERRLDRAVHKASTLDAATLREREFLAQRDTRHKQFVEAALLASTDFQPAASRADWTEQLVRALESYQPPKYGQPYGYPYPYPTSPGTPLPGTHETLQLEQVSFTVRSCFAAGTLVETSIGPVPIEQLRPGDRVLSQNIATGELAFQSLRELTVRPAAPLLAITVAGDTILATRGHPFWVNGAGWRMAKHLEVGQSLHTPAGSVAIEQLGDEPPREAYNLVVSGFGTYFVGAQRVLVHDNQPQSHHAMLVPGLAAND